MSCIVKLKCQLGPDSRAECPYKPGNSGHSAQKYALTGNGPKLQHLGQDPHLNFVKTCLEQGFGLAHLDPSWNQLSSAGVFQSGDLFWAYF